VGQCKASFLLGGAKWYETCRTEVMMSLRQLRFNPELMNRMYIFHQKLNRGDHLVPVVLYGEGYINGG